MCVLKSRLLSHIQYFQSDDTGNTVSTVLKCVYRYTGGDNVRDYIIFVYFILMLNFIRASRNQQIVPGISQFLLHYRKVSNMFDISGVRWVFQWGGSVTSHHDDVKILQL